MKNDFVEKGMLFTLRYLGTNIFYFDFLAWPARVKNKSERSTRKKVSLKSMLALRCIIGLNATEKHRVSWID